MCVNFEESEYMKGLLDYNVIDKPMTKTIHRSTKTVVPAALLEKERMYEWCVLMFNTEVINRVCLISDEYVTIKQLKCKLIIQ